MLKAQEQHPKSNDWFTQVSKDLTDLEIQMNQVEIECMSSTAFKTLCKIKVKQIAFQYLEEKKKAHKLVKHIKYEKFEMATYLKEGVPKLSVQERQYIFQCRVKDIDLRAHRSWKYEDIFCISCKNINNIETISHILACTPLINLNEKITYLPNQEDLYSDNIYEQVYVSSIIRESMHVQEKLNEQR